tara:strand:- start:307 stop:1137 length:831 start_codon:yes stop_codon:yes gene_type:complete
MSLSKQTINFERLLEFLEKLASEDTSKIKEIVDQRGIIYLYAGDEDEKGASGKGKIYSISSYSDYQVRLEYDGEFIDNYPNGDGIFYFYSFSNKMIPSECYLGEVYGFHPHGLGTIYVFNNISKKWNIKFNGSFKNGEIENEGREYHLGTNQTKFIGHYYNGLKSGFGVEFDVNGDKIYEGFFEGDEKNGHGIGYFGNLEVRGIWKYGKLSNELSTFLENFLRLNLKKRNIYQRCNRVFENRLKYEFPDSTVIMFPGCNLFEVKHFYESNSSTFVY